MGLKADAHAKHRHGFHGFMFATGIECSYPAVPLPGGGKFRVDEMEKTGHYRRWRDDFNLVKELGIEFLRYGPPYYRTHTGPGRYDWSFADETFDALDQMRIEPIVDLCHFGVPDWIGDFQNPEWPKLFAEYARAFAARFPWVRLYTPVNEIFIAALFSARHGYWNEGLRSERGFVTALKHLCQANLLAERAILEIQPNAIFIQSESSEYFHPEDPFCIDAADLLNEMRFLSLDLNYGQPLNVAMYEYLLENGMRREEYHWFLNNHLKNRCVMGTDYYATNEHLLRADGTTSAVGEVFGYYVIAKQYFNRYRLPVMHTETNVMDAELAPGWLRKEWANMHRLKQDGVPIIGFTWYSLTDQVDWDSTLIENNGRVNPLGLVDLERNIRPVGDYYRRLIKEWRGILPTENSSLTLCY
jgi:beta-glucosidase/6-phospho-beta-glucosidase/beta-galactosidase